MGIVGAALVNNAKGGYTKRQTYISNDLDSEILIFGSSRALQHYDPNIFEDSLGMTAYNCGFEGNGIISAYGYIKMIEKRYYPKIIIYEIMPRLDLLSRDNHTFLGILKYFYDKDGIDSIFWSIDKTERYKMISSMYRYNSMLPLIIMDNFHPFHNYDKGYRPLCDNKGIVPIKMNIPKKNRKKNNPSNVRRTNYKQRIPRYDNLKLYYLERLIKDCKGKTTLVFIVSPWYKNKAEDILKPIQVLCEKYDVPLISHFTDSTFNDKKDYFYDASHLNRRGAMEYSKTIASEIKLLIDK